MTPSGKSYPCTCSSQNAKNITLSADEDLIERARLVARAQQTRLNAAFREWLAPFTASSGDTQSFDAVMAQMRHVDAG